MLNKDGGGGGGEHISALGTTDEKANPWGHTGCPMPDAPHRFFIPRQDLHRKVVSPFVLPFLIFLLFLKQGDSPEVKSL